MNYSFFCLCYNSHSVQVSKAVLWYILPLLKGYISAASFDLEANSAYHTYHLRRMSGSFLLWKCHACLKWQFVTSNGFKCFLIIVLESSKQFNLRVFIFNKRNYIFLIAKCWIGDLEYPKCRVKAMCSLIMVKNPTKHKIYHFRHF